MNNESKKDGTPPPDDHVASPGPRPSSLSQNTSGSFDIPPEVKLHIAKELAPVLVAAESTEREQEPVHKGTAAKDKDGEPITNADIEALYRALAKQRGIWLGLPEEQRQGQRETFGQALKLASTTLDRYSAQESHNAERRKLAVDAYFALDHLLQIYDEEIETAKRLGKRRPAGRRGRATVATAPVPLNLPPVGELQLRPLLLGLIVASALGLAIWRGAVFWGGPDVDASLAATKHIRGDKKRVGVDTEGKSVAVNEDLVAGIPVITHLRLDQDREGNLRARASVIDDGGKPPTLTFKWYQGDSPIKEEERGFLDVALVETGKSYAVEVVANDGEKSSRPIRTKQLVAAEIAQ